MPIEFWSFLVSVLAACLAAWSLIRQYNVRGPQLEILNATDVQHRVPRYHKELPLDIQTKFPEIPDAAPGHALVKLVFGNSGDRVGIIKIQNCSVRINQSGYNGIIKTAYDKYVLVPAYAIVETDVLLKNIQIGENNIETTLEIKLEYGGYDANNSHYKHQGNVEKSISVNLIRGDEENWWISGDNVFYQ